jgi:hypothetical protein
VAPRSKLPKTRLESLYRKNKNPFQERESGERGASTAMRLLLLSNQWARRDLEIW